MKKEIIDIEVKVDEAVKSIDKVNDSLNDLGDTIVDNNKNTTKSLKATEKASKTTASAVKGVGVALKAVGIGLILKAFALFTDVLSENQKTLDFATNSFNFVSLAVNDLINNVDAVIGWFKKLGSVVGAVFKGQFGVAAVIMKDAINDLVEYTEETAKAAVETTDLANRAAVAAAKNAGLVEQYDRQAEKLRQIRDDESESIEARIQANIDLGIVLEEQEKAMLRNADIVLAAAQAEFNRNQNIENEVALIEAKNEKLGVLAQIEGFRSEQLVNENSLNREKLDLLKEEEELRQAANEELQEYYDEQERIVTDAEDRRIDKEYKASQARKEIAKLEAEAKLQALDSYANALRSIGHLIGRETAAGKAASVAATLISTYTSATKAYESQLSIPTPDAPIRAALAAGVAVASGLANVKAILAVKTPSRGGGGGGGGQRTSAPKAQTPQFNVVGQSDTNQLAGAISGQETPIVKAVVVASDVTTQQSADRNIVDTATFG